MELINREGTDAHATASQKADQHTKDPEQPASLSPYRVPAPYGEAAGADAVSSVAAPLLAAGAITLAGVVLQEEKALRYPGIVLLMLTSAIFMLVTSVQCGAWARRYATTPGEMLQWWPDANTARIEILVKEQEFYSQRHMVWAWGSSLSFNSGILLLWGALIAALIPNTDSLQQNWRWIAAGVAGVGMLVELLWIVPSSSVDYRRRRRHLINEAQGG